MKKDKIEGIVFLLPSDIRQMKDQKKIAALVLNKEEVEKPKGVEQAEEMKRKLDQLRDVRIKLKKLADVQKKLRELLESLAKKLEDCES